MRNVAAILPLKSELYGKFQRFNVINSNYKNKNFQKFQSEKKIVKHFARPKQQTALRNLLS